MFEADDYREAARMAHREARWTFWKFLFLTIQIILVLAGIAFGLRSLGLWGGTAVEREVFEASYQRTESIRAQIATDEAVLVEIERKIANPELDAVTRTNMEAQAAAARVRIAAAKGRQ